MGRRAIAICGIVQGVGFRPYVYGLATRLQLRGFIKNVNGGVHIEVEGEPLSLDRFLDELTAQPPPLARIDELRWSPRPPCNDPAFRIEPSDRDEDSPIFISPDVATCSDCLAELFDPRDRRYRYPFLNCTNCGPRLTIITGSPYDRERTSMASFAMCAECRAEYDDPAERRFHAQPIACPACGPRLWLLDESGQPISGIDPVAGAIASLRGGRIGAIKGLGGYHLGCIASDAAAVAELRSRKHRDEKPFALMVKDIAAARALCQISPAEEVLLLSPRRPIVLLRRRPETVLAEESIAGESLAGRDAALYPLAPPAPARAGRYSPGDDQRQSIRRADRLSRPRCARTPGGDRRLLPRAQPADSSPLR